jgi:y4mF family transcriptional regulator
MNKNYISNSADLGKKIRTKRKDLKINQTELAGICNVGTRFISDLENGKPSIEFDKALKVARNIGIKLIAEDL